MPRRRRNKPVKYDQLLKRMQKKLTFVFMLFCFLFVFLIGRLMYIEYTSGDKYEKIVLSQQKYDSTIIPFQRGDIRDTKGTVLATSVDVYNVILDCKQLNANPDCVDSTVAAITKCFPDILESDIRAALSQKSTSQYVILAKKVSYEQTATFRELQENKETKDTIAGVWFEKEYIRQYPYSTLASSLLGFVTSGNSGSIGLENEYNSVLNGVNGRSYGYLNDDSNLEKTVIEPVNGNTLVTTIDVNVQTVVEQEILRFNQEYASEGRNGSLHTACIVMNPQNGEIIAMANYPNFDLNNPRDLSAYYTEEELEIMTDEEEIDALNELWQNFCVYYTYEPGSTFKPFTVAMGLETGKLNGDESYYCDGGQKVSGHDIKCVNRNGHGMLTVQGALMESCNDALMQMVDVIGPQTFCEYQSKFGFGQKTNIDLPGEASTANLLYTEEQLTRTASNLATNSFGQNFNTTMIQLASAFASLVNGGNLYQPHVINYIEDDAGNVVETYDPVVLKKTVSKETSEQMKEYLYQVVENGTGSTAAVEGYDIGGKTGTAEKLPRKTGNYLVSFIGYVPQDSPQLLIYTIVDQPNTDDQAHSSYAQQITHNILTQILPYMNIEPASGSITTEGEEETNQQ